MNIRPHIRASDLDAQIDAILELLARKTKKKELSDRSRVHDREGLAKLVCCAVAADALDKELGRTLITFSGRGKVVAAEGPSLLVSRYIWKETRRPQWPSVLLEQEPCAGDDPAIDVWAEFRDPDDTALATLRVQPWCTSVITHASGKIVARLAPEALIALVQVDGIYAPARTERGPDEFAPTLGNVEDPVPSSEAAPTAPGAGVW